MRWVRIVIISVFVFPGEMQARPISWADGWTVMQNNNRDVNSVHIHYSPTPLYSVGLRSEYHRGDEFQLHVLQQNRLLKRWNLPDAQGNLYGKLGVGVAEDNDDVSAAVVGGIAGDFETRRYFVSYENRFTRADEIDTSFHQFGRVGIAPYVGSYDDLHTWLMLEVHHSPGDDDNKNYSATPLVRLFKANWLVEGGVSNEGDLLFNWIVRF